MRGFAHGEELAHVGGEVGGLAEFDVEFDETGEGGLVEGVAFGGVSENIAGLGFGSHALEAVGNGDEVFGADVGLFEEVLEESVGGDGIAQAVVGDGSQAVENRGITGRGAPVGVLREKLLRGVECPAVVLGHDVGFDGHEGGAFPVEVIGLAVIKNPSRKVGASGVGGEVSEGEQGFGVFGKVAEDFVNGGLDLGVVFFLVVNVEEIDAGTRTVGIGELAQDAGLAEFGFESGIPQVGDELTIDLLVSWSLLGEFAEGGEGKFALATLPGDAGVKQHAVAHVVEVVSFQNVLREIVVAAVIRGGGFGESDEAVGGSGVFIALEELVGERDDGVVLLLLEQEGENGFQVVGVSVRDVVGIDAGEECRLRIVGAAGEELELRQQEAAFAVGGRLRDAYAKIAYGGSVIAFADELLGLFDHVVAARDLIVGIDGGNEEEEHLGVTDFGEIPFVFDK